MRRATKHPVVSERARLGATAVGLGGLAFGVIQIVQGSVSAFNPRPVVVVMSALAIGLIGLTAERARSVSTTSRTLRAALRIWPLPRLRDVDLLTLGVFPQASPGGGTEFAPYLPRDTDPELEETLSRGGLSIVVGPPRAGKSRSAAEAARRLWPDQGIVIPADGAGLGELIHDAGFTPPEDAIWWLDDLERFVDRLDAPALSWLTADRHTVVATMRQEAWEAMLQASGDAGERGRRLSAAAGVFVQQPMPPDAGAAAAEQRDPHIKAPIGALAVPTTDPPGAPGQSSHVPVARSRRFADPVLAAALIATAAALAALGVVLAAGGFAVRKPPPIGAQLNAIRQDAARAGWRTVYSLTTDRLHGTDDRSHVFVLRSRKGSDELRVYDEVDGILRSRFAFRPRTGGRRFVADASVDIRAQQDSAPIDYFMLEPPLGADINGDGSRELIVAYRAYPSVMFRGFHVPLIVGWDDRDETYRLSPALGPRTDMRLARDDHATRMATYKRPFKIVDVLNKDEPPLRAYAASSLIVLDDGVLATASELDGPRSPVSALVAVKLFDLYMENGSVLNATSLCTARDVFRAERRVGADFRVFLKQKAPGLEQSAGLLAALQPGCAP